MAGGSGRRMGAEVPKQFLVLAGRPLLIHTLERWHRAAPSVSLVLVLPAGQITTWKALAAQYDCRVPHAVVAGGETRFESVRSGLRHLPNDTGLVAVHDGVRPMVTGPLLDRGFALAAERGSAVASVALKDSIREGDEQKSRAVERSLYRLVQTPQIFKIGLIRAAYEQVSHDQFTDCAGVAEAAGANVFLYEGAYDNLKVTTPEDLRWAEALLGGARSIDSFSRSGASEQA